MADHDDQVAEEQGRTYFAELISEVAEQPLAKVSTHVDGAIDRVQVRIDDLERLMQSTRAAAASNTDQVRGLRRDLSDGLESIKDRLEIADRALNRRADGLHEDLASVEGRTVARIVAELTDQGSALWRVERGITDLDAAVTALAQQENERERRQLEADSKVDAQLAKASQTLSEQVLAMATRLSGLQEELEAQRSMLTAGQEEDKRRATTMVWLGTGGLSAIVALLVVLLVRG